MIDPDLVWTIAVGFTTVRPVIPDQFTHHVRVMAPDCIDARETAHAMVNGHKGVTMVTSVRIVDCVA